MINFQNTKYIISVPNYKIMPHKPMAEILLVGRSNVGKSSLINCLCSNKHMAKVSAKPGKTKYLNYFNVDNNFYLVDAPGYGYTASGTRHDDNFGSMMENYFENPNLKGVIFLVDSRHKPTRDDIDFYNFIIGEKIPFVIALTKCDKINQKEKSATTKLLKEHFKGVNAIDFIFTTINDRNSMIGLIKKIEEFIS